MKNSEKLGKLKDKVDNLRSALDIPMPADFHVKQMKSELEDLSQELRQLHIEETGEDPWCD